MELQRERRYNKKSMKRKKVIPMQQTLPPAAADAERHRQERRAFLYLPLLALAVTVVVELFNHKSFTDGPAGFWRFMTEEPLAFLVNFLIVLPVSYTQLMGSTPVTPRSAPVRDSSPINAACWAGGGSSRPAASSPTKMGRS